MTAPIRSPQSPAGVPSEGGGSVLENLDVQRLGLALSRRPWTTLVLIPVRDGPSLVELGQALVDVGALFLSCEVRLVDAGGALVRDVPRLLFEIYERATAEQRTIVVADSLLTSPATLPLAQRADAAILVALLRRSSLEDARTTLELMGQERFLGAITLEDKAVR